MQTNTIQIQKTQKWRYLDIIAAAAGSLFLALLSQVSIPLPGTPVPLTLQTLGVFLLGGFLGGRIAIVSILLYLLEGALGLPVFAGWKINPLWILSPNAGFLLSFIPAVMLIGKLGKGVLSLSLAQAVISIIGMLWLSFYVGSLKSAFFLGVLPFLVGAGIKIIAGTLILKSYHLIRRKP
jgi:biotin transport system substrate-specific component